MSTSHSSIGVSLRPWNQKKTVKKITMSESENPVYSTICYLPYWQRSYWQTGRQYTRNIQISWNNSVVSTLSHHFSMVITGYFFDHAVTFLISERWLHCRVEARAMASIKIRKVASDKKIVTRFLTSGFLHGSVPMIHKKNISKKSRDTVP